MAGATRTSEKLNDVSTEARSSSETKLNWMERISLRRSLRLVGIVTTPKSVRWVD